MREKDTPYGRLLVADTQEELFARAAALVEEGRAAAAGRDFSCALSGGSTPQDWYRWCTAKRARLAAPGEIQWFTSDERCVPLASGESNFGNADRELLAPLSVPAAHKHPWPVALAPAAAAAEFARTAAARLGRGRGFDLCFLGLGPDSHTASLFPGCPLLADDGGALFAAVEWPDRGWRLTITPSGLRACARVAVLCDGAEKAAALRRVMTAPYAPREIPGQILRTCAGRTVWLVDAAAAGALAGPG